MSLRTRLSRMIGIPWLRAASQPFRAPHEGNVSEDERKRNLERQQFDEEISLMRRELDLLTRAPKNADAD